MANIAWLPRDFELSQKLKRARVEAEIAQLPPEEPPEDIPWWQRLFNRPWRESGRLSGNVIPQPTYEIAKAMMRLEQDFPMETPLDTFLSGGDPEYLRRMREARAQRAKTAPERLARLEEAEKSTFAPEGSTLAQIERNVAGLADIAGFIPGGGGIAGLAKKAKKLPKGIKPLLAEGVKAVPEAPVTPEITPLVRLKEISERLKEINESIQTTKVGRPSKNTLAIREKLQTEFDTLSKEADKLAKPVAPKAEVPPVPPEKPAAMGVGEIPPTKPPETAVGAVAETAPKEGKFFLPEPPREKAPLIAHAKKEVGSSFRQGFRKPKVGVFETIEEARQQVLKARDLGENARNYVSSYIRQAGNLTKEFGLDAQGFATKVGNPEKRSLAINDILSNYTHYKLTSAQVEIAKRQGFVYKEALKLAKSYGVKISELGGPDEYWQYIARRVKGKINPKTGQLEIPPSVTGGFKMGAKISAQKERLFEEMAQGVDLGLLYEKPDQVINQHIKGIYRLIGNKQAEQTVKTLTRDITKEAPLVFGERALAQPALRSRAAAVEVANAIDKIFTPEQELKALRVAADVSGALVGQVAALDISAPFIQGLPLLGHDIKMALKGKPTAIWAKSYGNMLKAIKNPEAINNFRMKNQDLYKRAIEAGVMVGESEFVAGVPLAGRALGKIPKAGPALREGYRQTWGRMGQAYSDFLEVSRIKLFEQMEPAWVREGGNALDLGALANRMSGAVSASARGVGANRRLVERIAAFAPNYMRSSLLLLKDLAGRQATAKEVQSTLATMLGVGTGVYYVFEKMKGEEPKMKPWPKRLGGDGAEAFTTEINGQRVGLGSWLYGMIKMLAEIGAVAVDDPVSLAKFNSYHPLMRFLKTKMGIGVGLVTELATGRNFWGQSFESPNDYLLRIAESLFPISGQSIIEKPSSGQEKTLRGIATRMGIETLGLRAFPAPATNAKKQFSESLKRMRNKTDVSNLKDSFKEKLKKLRR